MARSAVYSLALAAALAGCDNGLSPPAEPPAGVLVVDITYAGHPEAWPPPEELHNLVFVAMRFIPVDTTDFLQLNRMVFSDRLSFNVSDQTVVLDNVQAGLYPYSGVAQKYGPGAFDWRPVGLVEDDGGIFVIARDETTRVSVTADFQNRPDFPPPPPE